ncbi:hypothetical protein FVB9288_02618 [Flavobacterium sp. CECT 9288]|jgi:hypothetical protein|uniref:DUF6702 family protein n=1 Tax=Flavobacterium sp. CECT 9288 TaxID=2845819 RepID=UPI001E32BAEB|nr:DUF6702 family protein [Flavobacterium sp. CECT 9288]CAH0336891.1 hypothetical protein FVB9288_02618 [Flavobacterium sp. CECT 9288]
MKKIITRVLFVLLILSMSSFAAHKFYVALFQVNYVSEKKMIQITARIFVDDLNNALEKKHNRKINLGSEMETAEDVLLLKKYLNEKCIIKVDGQTKVINFVSKEMEGDVLICYLSIKEIKKIKALDIYNAVLTQNNAEQQNIMHFNVLGVKNTLLFTTSTSKGVLKY